jgi:hypothetical protein
LHIGPPENLPDCAFIPPSSPRLYLNTLDRDESATIERDTEPIVRATWAVSLGTARFKEPLSRTIVERLL